MMSDGSVSTASVNAKTVVAGTVRTQDRKIRWSVMGAVQELMDGETTLNSEQTDFNDVVPLWRTF
jgi:hypothetical protein